MESALFPGGIACVHLLISTPGKLHRATCCRRQLGQEKSTYDLRCPEHSKHEHGKLGGGRVALKSSEFLQFANACAERLPNRCPGSGELVPIQHSSFTEVVTFFVCGCVCTQSFKHLELVCIPAPLEKDCPQRTIRARR